MRDKRCDACVRRVSLVGHRPALNTYTAYIGLNASNMIENMPETRRLILSVLCFFVLIINTGSMMEPGLDNDRNTKIFIPQERIEEKYWLSFSDSGSNNAPKLSVIKSNSEGVKIRVVVEGMWVSRRTVENREFQILSLPDCASMNQLGKPQLPVLRAVVAIPENSCPEVYIYHTETIEFQSFELYPAQEPELELGQSSAKCREFVFDIETYSKDASYPPEPLHIESSGMIRNLNFLQLRICPFAYNPVKKKLVVYRVLELEIMFSASLVPWKSDEKSISMIASVPDRIYSDIILNYETAKSWFSDRNHGARKGSPARSNVSLTPHDLRNTSNAADYLIITNQTFYNTTLPFAALKASSGLKVMVVNDTAIYAEFNISHGRDTAIRDFVSYACWNWSIEPLYVLLVGDVAQIPVHYYAGGVASDHYYACVKGTDLYPDVIVGRLSVSTLDELSTVIAKIQNYTKNPPAGNWTQKILLAAHEGIGEGDVYRLCKESIRNTLTTQASYGQFYSIDTAYAGEGAKLAKLIAAINEGRLLVNYRGHGNPRGWNSVNLSLTVSDVANLNNSGKPPFVISLCCSNAAIDYGSDCIGEVFLKAKDKGAIGFLGATGVTFTEPHNDYDKFIFNTTFNDGIYTIGFSVFKSKLKVLNKWGSDPTALTNIKMSMFLGDPALSLLKPFNSSHPFPDLRLENLTFSCVAEGETVTISATVLNSGNANATNINVSVYAGNPVFGGSKLGTWQYSGTIPCNGSQNLSFVWNTSGFCGKITIYLWADAENSVLELDDENNIVSGVLTINPATVTYNFRADRWFLISIPLVLERWTIAEIFGPILNNISAINYFDAHTGTWKKYIQTREEHLNTLTEINITMGLWVRTTADCNLTLTGRCPVAGTTIWLKKGWNLVGYPSYRTRNVTQLKAEIKYCDRIQYYDAQNPYGLRELDDTGLLQPKNGYWLHVTADCKWVVSW